MSLVPALALALALFGDSATEASVRFKRGVELYQRGAVREALEQFLVSYRLSPNPNLAFNIATCFEELKNYDAAFSAYSEYLTFDVLTPQEQEEGRAALARIIPRVARLTVTSTPAGASIFIDRETLGQYGQTPRTFAAPAGRHEVILVLPGHVTTRQPVELTQGDLARLDVPLALQHGRVAIESEPSGSRVRLEDGAGRLLGTTPLEVSLPIGARQLHLQHDGYEPEERTVDVRTDQIAQLRVAHRALPEKTGQLRILTNVPTALISVDGREAGFSPLVLELPEGRHGISVHRVGYRPWTEQVQIGADRLLAAEVTLEPKDQDTGRGIWPWVLLTTSAVAGVTALGLSIEAIRNRVEFPDDPTRSRFDRTRELNIAADVMWVVTLLGSAATVATFVLQEPPAERDSTGTVTEVDRLAAPRAREAGPEDG